MNEEPIADFEADVDRLLQPVIASPRRKAAMRLELLSHLGLDGAFFVGNLLLPQKKKGYVVKRGKAGYGGVWPPYVAPCKADSRSPCPYLSKLQKLP